VPQRTCGPIRNAHRPGALEQVRPQVLRRRHI
jgi:hypothetical protein